MIAVPPMSLVRQIVAEEARTAGAPVERVFTRCRYAEVVWTKRRAWKRLRALGYSLKGIGHVFDVDHSVIAHGVKLHAGDEPPPPPSRRKYQWRQSQERRRNRKAKRSKLTEMSRAWQCQQARVA